MTSNVASSTKQMRPRFKLFSEVLSELRKVVWLNRREALYLSMLVILLSVAIGLLLGAFDFGFAQLAQKVLMGG